MNKLIIRRLSSSTFMTAQQNFEYLASLGILVFDFDYTSVNSGNCSNHECLSFCCQFCKGSLMKVHYPKLYNMAHLLSLNVLLLPKDLTIIFHLLLLQLVLCRVAAIKSVPVHHP